MRKTLKTNPWTKRGFSLVELLVASALFTIVVAVTAGSFITVLDASRQSRELNKLMLAVDFVMEDMSRTIRTGKNFTIAPGGQQVSFTDEEDRTIEYRYNNSSAQKRVNNTGPWMPLVPAEITITRLRFSGETTGALNQPRIRINLVGELEEAGTFRLQTSVTQRELNF